MMNSQYLERFKRLKDKNFHTLKGNLILVEKLPEPEKKTKSGLILAVDDGRKQINGMGADVPHFCVVLDVGEGYTDGESGSLVEGSMGVKVGDIVMVPRLSIKYFSMFADLHNYVPDTIGVTRESEIQITYASPEAYEQYFKELNHNGQL